MTLSGSVESREPVQWQCSAVLFINWNWLTDQKTKESIRPSDGFVGVWPLNTHISEEEIKYWKRFTVDITLKSGNLNGGGASGRAGRFLGPAALNNGHSDDTRKQYNSSSIYNNQHDHVSVKSPLSICQAYQYWIRSFITIIRTAGDNLVDWGCKNGRNISNSQLNRTIRKVCVIISVYYSREVLAGVVISEFDVVLIIENRVVIPILWVRVQHNSWECKVFSKEWLSRCRRKILCYFVGYGQVKRKLDRKSVV